MLVDELKKRVMQAIKSRNDIEKEVLRVALGEIQTVEARGAKLTDEEAGAIVRKLVKANQETIAVSENPEQKAVLQQEIAILESLLPKTLGVEEIVIALAPAIEAIKGAANDGQATGIAMKHLKSTGASVGGKDVAEAVKRLRG
jgi:uncharacterized protein